MTTVRLGIHAYKRTVGGAPEIKLVNRFVEKEPTNLREQTALMSRCGTALLKVFTGTGANVTPRGLYSKPGLFGDDLFVVVGQNLYRYNDTTGVVPIAGIIGGTGRPYMTWDKGLFNAAGLPYERMFISDGALLSYYDGPGHANSTVTLAGTVTNQILKIGSAYYTWSFTPATGTLTKPGTITNQVVQIGTTFYAWNAAVNTGTPAGTVANPWLVAPGTDPLGNLVKAIMATGTPGTTYSTALTVANTLVTAAAVGGPPATSVTISSIGTTTAANSIATTVYSGTAGALAWSSATLIGGGNQVDSNAPDGSALHPFRVLFNTDPLTALAKAINGTGKSGVDYSTVITAANTEVAAQAIGGPPATSLKISAIVTTAAGNLLATTVYSGVAGVLTWSNTTLQGGGVHAIYGVTVPTGEGIGPLATLNHFIMCAVAGTQKIFFLRPASTTMDALDFASKESNPDPVSELITVGDFTYVIGEGSTELWYSTGQNAAPLSPVAGRTSARGALAGTAVNVREDVVLVGDDGVVYSMLNGPNRISDNAIEERIRTQLRRERGL